MAAVSYEWAVSADGEEWSVVDTEDDETFGVTADLLGMYVKVTVTAEDGETASDVTTEPVEPYGIIEIESAEATAVNEIEVLLAYSIDPDDTVVELTKGNAAVPATVAWDEDYKVATITTAAKMTKGTYTVTISSIEDADNEDSAEVEIEDQKVAEIVILNDVALTNADKDIAYAYYDVLDQYGESLRSSTSIQWSGSCNIKANKTNGELQLKKIGDVDWMYSEQIYITGVYTKTGVSTSATLKVGTEQNLDTIEMVGFVKKGTSTIIPAKEGLPADFKDGEYYLLFNALDQNGNALAADNINKEDVTFVSDNVLVVKELTKFYNDGLTGLTIAGTEYCAVEVTPGIKVADGGEVTVTAIANKTGNTTKVNFMVGEDAVVASFTMGQPTGIVADGDTGVEIPFVAKDQNGNTITNFRTLAKQETFNTLSFNTSEGLLALKEQDDGTAILAWSDVKKNGDPNVTWADAASTDGIDRPISLTAIVVGGETDNEMISVSDMRRPDAVAAVKMDSVYVEGAAFTLTNATSFKFYDQYGTLIGTTWGADNGFFAAAATEGTLKGTEFSGYDFGIRVKNAGSGKIYRNGGTTDIVDPDTKEFVIAKTGGDTTVGFKTTTDIKSAATGEGFKFEIAKFKATDSTPDRQVASDWEAVSTSKYVPVTVVDITQVKGLTIDPLNTFYVGGLKDEDDHDITGDGIIANAADLGAEAKGTKTDGSHKGIYAEDDDAYYQEVKVSGTYNGTTVEVPASYFEITAYKLADTPVDGETDHIFDAIISYDDAEYDPTNPLAASNKGLQVSDLYDKASAKGVAKLATDEVTATVYKPYTEDDCFWAWDPVNFELTDRQIADGETTAEAKAAANATFGTTNKNAAKDELGARAEATAINTLMEGEIRTDTTAHRDADLTEFMALADPAAATKADATATLATATSEVTLKEAALGAAALPAGEQEAVEDYAATITYESIEGDINTWVGTNVTNTDDQTAAKNYLQAVRVQAVAEHDLYLWNAKEAKVAALAAKSVSDGAVDAIFEEALEANDEGPHIGVVDGGVYDTAKATITLSDQAPKATAIEGLAASYTFNPNDTGIINPDILGELEDVAVVDQYGVAMTDDLGNPLPLTLTVTNITESADGYAENNFKVTGNGTTDTAIEGAERGDTFDLIVSYGEIKETTSVTVGSDDLACISNYEGNEYKDDLVPTLETQRKAGLG